MRSIRPLITITVLVVVGVVLYVKINEGTPHASPSADEAWDQPVEGVPPLAASSVAPTTSDGAAPPWSSDPAAIATGTAPLASAAVDAGTATTPGVPPATAAVDVPATAENAASPTQPLVPAVPPIPEIAATQAEAPASAAATDASRWADASAGRYINPAAVSDDTTPASAAAGGTPAAEALPVTTAPPSAAPISAQPEVTTPEQMNAVTAAGSGVPSTPSPLDANPLRPSTQTTPPDRYGASGSATTTPATAPITPTAPPSPVEQSFVESWPGIQSMLDRGELTEAHKALSKWYGDPSLTPTDAERVDSLLSQLAGTVVYSTEHRLAPAYVVKQGETLETIAKEHNVPWQLLAKINGLAASDQVRPGQELKVVRGPFSAVVDLSRNQLTLMVDDRYAGRFPVTVTAGQTVHDGEWVVGKKSSEQAPGRALLLQGNSETPGAPAPMLVIASDALTTTAADGTVIKIAAKDAEELSDILSIGSRVVTRR